MKLLPVIGALLISSTAAQALDAKEALRTYKALSSKSESIHKGSSKKEVLKVLGKPQSKGSGGWGNLDTEFWHYLSFTDDSQHLSFSVRFAPNSDCSVVAIHTLRKNVEKKTLRKLSGMVNDVFPYLLPDGTDGFSCTVRLERIGHHTLVFPKGGRVIGTPEKGAKVLIEHHGSDFNLIYHGQNSLFLKSITFTKSGEDKTPNP